MLLTKLVISSSEYFAPKFCSCFYIWLMKYSSSSFLCLAAKSSSPLNSLTFTKCSFSLFLKSIVYSLSLSARLDIMLAFIYSSDLESDSSFPSLLSSFSLSFNRPVISLVLSKMLFWTSCSALSSMSKETLSRCACSFLSWLKVLSTYVRFLMISSWISTYSGGRFYLPYSRRLDAPSISSELALVANCCRLEL